MRERYAGWLPRYGDFVRRRRDRLGQVSTEVAGLDLPPAVFKTCPWSRGRSAKPVAAVVALLSARGTRQRNHRDAVAGCG